MNFFGVIERVDACADTLLRIVMRDEKQISESALKTEGVAAVVNSQTMFAIFWPA